MRRRQQARQEVNRRDARRRGIGLARRGRIRDGIRRDPRLRIDPRAVVVHYGYYLRDRRRILGRDEYLLVWYDLTESWEQPRHLTTQRWVNQMQVVDQWVQAGRQPLFIAWARTQNIDMRDIDEHQIRVRNMWLRSNTPLAIQDWAVGHGYYYEDDGIRRPRFRPAVLVINDPGIIGQLESTDTGSSEDDSDSSNSDPSENGSSENDVPAPVRPMTRRRARAQRED